MTAISGLVAVRPASSALARKSEALQIREAQLVSGRLVPRPDCKRGGRWHSRAEQNGKDGQGALTKASDALAKDNEPIRTTSVLKV